MTNLKVLFVDDDPNILSAHQRNFRKKFSVEVALGPAEGLALVGNGDPYGVIVADMQMPGMSGIEFLLQVRERAPETVRMMLTGNIDQETAVGAINQGKVYRFLTKPCSPEMLELSIEEGLKHYQLITAERQLLEDTLAGSIRMLVETLSLTEPQSFGTGQKIRDYTRRYLAGNPVRDAWSFELAGLLSQIGFVTVPPAIAVKARRGAPLTKEEAEMVARVPAIGHGLIQHIPRLGEAARMVLYHQKNYDGSGVPLDAVRAREIPLGGRLIKILMELVAHEERGLSKGAAVRQMSKEPHRFDPVLLESVRSTLQIEVTEAPPASPASPAGGPREVTQSELRTGDRLAANLMTRDGLLVVGSGSEITPLLLQRIANFSTVQGIKLPILVHN